MRDAEAMQLLERGFALHRQGQIEAAAELYRQVLKARPKDFNALHLYGTALGQLRRPAEALGFLERAIKAHDGSHDAYNNLGIVLHDLGRYKEAVQHFKASLRLEPRHAQSYTNLGKAYKYLGRYEDAIAQYRQALLCGGNFSSPHNNLAILQLSLGRFEEGWREYYHYRSAKVDLNPAIRQWVAVEPGMDRLAGKTVALLKEQGIGDELFFLRFAPALQARGASLTLVASPKMAPLFRRLPFLDEVLVEGEQGREPDLVLMLGDLPHLLGMKTADQAPPPVPLSVLPPGLDEARALLASLGPPPWVALTWRAGTAYEQQNKTLRANQEQDEALTKEAPRAQLARVVRELPGTLVSLQRKPLPGETEDMAAQLGRQVHDLSRLNDQMELLLGVLQLLDSYYCVSNTSVHLRASLGLPSQVLVPHPPEWRWTSLPGRSPWFPDCPVLRQRPDGTWPDAFE